MTDRTTLQDRRLESCHSAPVARLFSFQCSCFCFYIFHEKAKVTPSYRICSEEKNPIGQKATRGTIAPTLKQVSLEHLTKVVTKLQVLTPPRK